MRAEEKAQKAPITGFGFTLECWHVEDYPYSPSTAASSCIAAEYFTNYFTNEKLVRQVSSPFNNVTTEL